MNQALAIHPKVAGSTIAGSVTALVVYLVETYSSHTVPPTIAAALTSVLAFLGGYLAPMMHDSIPPALTLPTEPPEDDTTEPPAGQKAIAPAK